MVVKATGRLFKLAFWLTLFGTLWFAWSPRPPALLADDKLQHMLAFAVLTVLFSLAYPAVRWLWILVMLAALGALIEYVQAVPVLHRDSDIHDWYADLAAITIAMIICGIVRKFAGTRRGRTGPVNVSIE
jgi:hypothetical protein